MSERDNVHIDWLYVSMNVCMCYVRMHACVYACMHDFKCEYVCIHVCIHVCRPKYALMLLCVPYLPLKRVVSLLYLIP